MEYKKKLHTLNPKKEPKEIQIHQTKRESVTCVVDSCGIERGVRTLLASKVSGTLLGIWLLIPEYLRLGSWELLKRWSGGRHNDIAPRLAMQVLNEAALCVKGVRRSRSLCHQGFEVANGLPFIATDKEIHTLLEAHTIAEARELQIALGIQRERRGHYPGDILAIDPYRVATYSKRIMPKKKKRPSEPARKVVQDSFCLDTASGQPVGFTLGSSGKTVTVSSSELLGIIKGILPVDKLLLADSEHNSAKFLDFFHTENRLAILMPQRMTKQLKSAIQGLPYQRLWAGYSVAETTYSVGTSSQSYRLIAQRMGETPSDYTYKTFITTSTQSSVDLLTECYPQRWTIEEFFNFEAAMGWNTVGTLNLHILYGKLSLKLIAQAAVYQLRLKLPPPYRTWTAAHMGNSLFHGIDGDIRVRDDTILVTFYNVPEMLNLKCHYEDLPKKLEAEGVNPKIPWLFDFKLDFRFK
ncbi:transposase [Deltaproteobacteria bacterium TL4]